VYAQDRRPSRLGEAMRRFFRLPGFDPGEFPALGQLGIGPALVPVRLTSFPTADPLSCASRAARGAKMTRLVLGMLLLAWSAGCAGLEEIAPAASKEPPTGAVARIEALWKESVLEQMGRPVARGFSGRVYLFGREGDAPITAPGEIAVYTFDDGDASGEPTAIWRFSSEELKKVREKTMLGWSYALWIPWEAGTEEHDCTVIVRYRSPEGRVAASSPGRVRLPPLPAGGRDKRAAQATANAPVSVTS
jgi:hypothetical protein